MYQKVFQNVSSQEVGASGNNIEKETQKPHPNLKKYIFTENIWSAWNPMQVIVLIVNMYWFCRTKTHIFSL